MSTKMQIGLCLLSYLVMAEIMAVTYIITIRKSVQGMIASAIAGDNFFIFWTCVLAFFAWPAYWKEIESEYKSELTFNNRHSWRTVLSIFACRGVWWTFGWGCGAILAWHSAHFPYLYLVFSVCLLAVLYGYKKAACWALGY